MPCQPDHISPSMLDALTRGDRDKLDDMTRMLCALCEVVEKHHPDSPIQNSAGAIKGLHAWWANHKRLDTVEKQRKAEEAARREAKQALVDGALKKLSIEERNALGLFNF